MTRFCKRFADSSFDNYICKTKEQKELVDYLRQSVETGFKNTIIIGGVGTGKTHLAYAIVNAMAQLKESSYTGYKYYSEDKVCYISLKNLIDEIRRGWKDGSDMASYYAERELLIIDEVGVQYGSESERIELYSIFNKRYEDCMPTVLISNNSLTELQKLLGQRIYDRVTCGAKIFELTGKSYRQGE